MTCTNGFIWGQLGKDAYKRQVTGKGATFGEQKQTRVSCEKCDRMMAASSLRNHMDIINRMIMVQTWELDTGGGGRETYAVSFP